MIFKRYLFSFRAEALVRRIAWLSVIGVAIGVGSLILVQSVMRKFNTNIEERLLASEPHLVIYLEDRPKTGAEEKLGELYDQVKAIPDIRTYLFDVQDVVVRTGDGHFSGAVARGVERESLTRIMQDVQKVQNESRTNPWFIPDVSTENILRENEVLIGSSLAVSLSVFEGDGLMIVPPEALLLPPDQAPTYDRVTVGRKLDLNSADLNTSGLFYIRGEALKRLQSTAGVRSGLEVWAESPQALARVTEWLESQEHLRVQTWRERNAALFFALRLEKFVMAIFLSLSALIAGFSIISVMALLISQKSKELGIFMAMGLSSADVSSLFVRVGVMLCGVGVFAGVFWGTGAALYLEHFPLKILPDIYYDSRVSAQLSLGAVVVVTAVALGIAYLGARLPVRDLKHLSPVQVLRAGRRRT